MSNNIENLSAWQRFVKKMTKANELGKEEDVMLDHNYDGIRELDNVLPPWWVAGFIITAIIGAFYYVMIFTGNYNQEQEYADEVAQGKKEVAAWRAKDKLAHPEKYTEATAFTDAEHLAKGKALFTEKTCFACHAADGGGGIGPNLTDNKWILGGGFKKVFNTISKGGRPGKGMVAWEASISKADRELLASYVISLQRTTPANPKAPQGDITWSK